MGSVERREPCPKCREEGNDTTGDNLVMFDDGGGKCFSCGFVLRGNSSDGRDGPDTLDDSGGDRGWVPLQGEYRDLTHRGVTEAICRQYRYSCLEVKGQTLEVADYLNRKGDLVGQKVRGSGKRFMCKGSMGNAGLFGQHLWDSGGKRLIITEGEVDCLIIAQLLNGRWPVVSIPNGVAGAVKVFKMCLEYINSFEEVKICFDQDDAGHKAVVACAELLPPGKAKIVQLPRKDPGEMALHGETSKLSTCLWEAQTYSPDGILHVSDVIRMPKRKVRYMPYPWTEMNRKLYGQATGSLMMVTSGTGMGKSTYVRCLCHDHITKGRKVGMIMLEEGPEDTMHDIMSIESGIPIRKILAARDVNAQLEADGHDPIEFDVVDNLSDDMYKKLEKDIENKGLYLFDSSKLERGIDPLLSKMEYLATGLGCEVLVIDHITLVIATIGNGNERKEIDRCMGLFRGFVDRVGVHLIVVCQLRKSDGRGYEEGGRVTLQDLRGSSMLSQAPNTVIGIERDQQHPDPERRNTIVVRSLKDRLSGYTGIVMALRWDGAECRYIETDYVFDNDGGVVFASTEQLKQLDEKEIP